LREFVLGKDSSRRWTTPHRNATSDWNNNDDALSNSADDSDSDDDSDGRFDDATWHDQSMTRTVGMC
jgi:hypothetical protein